MRRHESGGEMHERERGSHVTEHASRATEGAGRTPEATPTGPIDCSLREVSAGYGTRVAIEHVDIEIRRGDLVAVVGPNGAGKSTLLKILAGLIKPWNGRVEVLGGPPGREAHRVAYVPQAELVDWQFPVTVADVVMMGRYPALGILRRPGPEDRRAVDAALEQVKMSQDRATQIGSLSGGQRRRVFLARALAAAPDLFLLDEPVTGVDPTTQEDLMAILQDEARLGKTIVATTHDLAGAAEHFRRVIAINRTVVADGPARLILDPQVLSRTYGGHLLVLEGKTVLMDDAHHHDEPSGDEHHHHVESETDR